MKKLNREGVALSRRELKCGRVDTFFRLKKLILTAEDAEDAEGRKF
jgi:hypothetical protein